VVVVQEQSELWVRSARQSNLHEQHDPLLPAQASDDRDVANAHSNHGMASFHTCERKKPSVCSVLYRAREKMRAQRINISTNECKLEQDLLVQSGHLSAALLVQLSVVVVFFISASFFLIGLFLLVRAHHHTACRAFCRARMAELLFRRDKDVWYPCVFAHDGQM
jgi:hypothetical protein